MTEQEFYQCIELTPFQGREPVIRGTNIRVVHIIDDFAKGMTFEEVLKEHHQLTQKHLQDVFIYTQTVFKELETARLIGLLGWWT